jgi:serine/threonine protein kinase
MTNNQAIYNLVALGAAIGPRLARGQSSTVSFAGEESGRKWLRKSASKGGQPNLIRTEVVLLRVLMKTGLVPRLHEDSSTDEWGTVEDEFMMELLDNAASLGDYVESALAGSIPMETVQGLVSQAADALRRIAAMGIYHGDPHPDNFVVVLSMKGELVVKVIDWGWAFTAPSVSRKLSRLEDRWEDMQESLADERTWVPEDEEDVLGYAKRTLLERADGFEGVEAFYSLVGKAFN